MDLVVIEAPGKVGALEVGLRQCGLTDVRLFATKGHLAGMPPQLWPVGIDDQFFERARAPRDPRRVERLKEQARVAVASGGRIIVATDADPEGDAIAWDVKQALAPVTRSDERILRLRLRGLDRSAIQQGLGSLHPVSRAAAVPARARAILDRLLGAAFSGRGRVVGRVTSALLAVVTETRPALRRVRLVIPAADAGRPFIARVPVGRGLSLEAARDLMTRHWRPVAPGPEQRAAPPPPHMGDVMLTAADELGLPIAETAAAMQRLYEDGRLSYPRAGHRVLSREASGRVARLARHYGYVFDERLVPRPGKGTVHDAPHPLREVPLTADPKSLGLDETVLWLVGRGVVSAGMIRRVERADPAALAATVRDVDPEVREALLAAEWTRDSGMRWPGREDWLEPVLEERRADTVALECMLNHGLGRPSTWAAHAEAFAYRGLVTAGLELSEKGAAWLEAAPSDMRSAEFAGRIEKAVDMGPQGEDWTGRARRLVDEVLPADIRERILAMVEAESRRVGPVRDRAAEEEAAFGFGR